MSYRERIAIEIDRRRPEQIRIYLGPSASSVLAKTCSNGEEVFEYLWLVLRVPPELAAAKIAELERAGPSVAFEYKRLPERERRRAGPRVRPEA